MNVSFERTIMLGRQQMYATNDVLEPLFKQHNLTFNSDAFSSQKYAEAFFELLGANTVDSLDYSGYENASIIHDLNSPVPDHMNNQYSVVFDGGTLEHVFNFPVAVENCMKMIKVGGHFISITPTNNHCGHGFYQFSPELYFSLFKPARGFRIKSVMIAVDSEADGIQEWYTVEDPDQVKARVTLSNCDPTYMMVLAEKVTEVQHFTDVPYQSDYEEVWETSSSNNEEKLTLSKKIYRMLIAKNVRDVIYKLKSKKHRSKKVHGLGKVNSKFFKKTDFN